MSVNRRKTLCAFRPTSSGVERVDRFFQIDAKPIASTISISSAITISNTTEISNVRARFRRWHRSRLSDNALFASAIHLAEHMDEAPVILLACNGTDFPTYA